MRTLANKGTGRNGKGEPDRIPPMFPGYQCQPKPTPICSFLETMICRVGEQFVLSCKIELAPEPLTTKYKKECVAIG